MGVRGSFHLHGLPSCALLRSRLAFHRSPTCRRHSSRRVHQGAQEALDIYQNGGQGNELFHFLFFIFSFFIGVCFAISALYFIMRNFRRSVLFRQERITFITSFKIEKGIQFNIFLCSSLNLFVSQSLTQSRMYIFVPFWPVSRLTKQLCTDG